MQIDLIIVFVTFAVAMIKYPDKRNLRETIFFNSLQFDMGSFHGGEEHVVAGMEDKVIGAGGQQPH